MVLQKIHWKRFFFISENNSFKFLRKATMINKNGIIQKKRKAELQIQLPPSTDITRFSTKVTAKNNADNNPNNSAEDLLDFILR